jgi:hypothetical protein
LARRIDEIHQELPVPDDELTELICKNFSDSGKADDTDINFMFAEFTRINRKSLLINDDAGEGNVNPVCIFIQTVLEKFQLDDVVGFSWSGTCSKPDPEGFGGGAVVITRNDSGWINTGSWLFDTMEKLSKKQAAAVAKQ